MGFLRQANAVAAGAVGLAIGWTLAAAAGRRRTPSRPREHALASPDALSLATEALARAIEARTHWAGRSLRRMQRHAVALAVRAGLSHEDVEAVRVAALLHDIGTLAVPPHILAKPGPLTADEFERVRVHPEAGASLLADIEFPTPVAPLILSHHERWDGRGYPAGLRGEEIPLGARIVAITDCYNSLRSSRPYRGSHSPADARAILAREAGTALDPHLVDLYLRSLPALEATDWADPGNATFDGIATAQRESALLYDLSQAMNVTLGVEDTVRALLARLRGLVSHQAAAVYLLGDDGLLRCAASEGTNAASQRILPLDDDQAAPVRAIRQGHTVVNGDPVREIVQGVAGSATTYRSSLVAPLAASGSIFGALSLYSTATEAFAAEDARTLDRVTAHAASALFNALRFEQARNDSLTDALTGLPNARFLVMHLTQELARATRLGCELSLLMIDVDEFKKVNDVAGHHVGDRVLREVARVLRSGVRAYDVCARYAGDEFLVMLPECGRQEVGDRLAQLEQALSRVSVDGGERRLRVRASVGAAVFPHDGDSFEALLQAADREMYRHKARTREPRRTIPLTPVPPPSSNDDRRRRLG